jgi:hypothetical protein
LLAERIGLPQAEVTRIAIGGFLHDLGKIAIPDAILGKTDKLTDAVARVCFGTQGGESKKNECAIAAARTDTVAIRSSTGRSRLRWSKVF